MVPARVFGVSGLVCWFWTCLDFYRGAGLLFVVSTCVFWVPGLALWCLDLRVNVVWVPGLVFLVSGVAFWMPGLEF